MGNLTTERKPLLRPCPRIFAGEAESSGSNGPSVNLGTGWSLLSFQGVRLETMEAADDEGVPELSPEELREIMEAAGPPVDDEVSKTQVHRALRSLLTGD